MSLVKNIVLIEELKKVIYANKHINKYYSKVYPNTKYSLDDILDELIFILETGVSFKKHRGKIKGDTLRFHFNRFNKFGIFGKLKNKISTLYKKKVNIIGLSEDPKPQTYSIDSTHALNVNGIKGTGRNSLFKGKRGIKVSTIVDKKGFIISSIVKKANHHDITFAKRHIKELKKKLDDNKIPYKITKTSKFILADSAYDSKDLRKFIIDNGFIPLIYRNKRNIKNEQNIQKLTSDEIKIYKERSIVETCFSWMKKNKRIKELNEKRIKAYNGFLNLAICKINISVINRLTNHYTNKTN